MVKKSISKNTRLDKLFAEICSLFFSRWHNGRQWALKQGYRSDEFQEDGFCDKANKNIWVSPSVVVNGGDELELVIIHEICHAVIGLGHGKRFRNRLLTVANIAKANNKSNLSELLRQEIEMYDGPTITADEVYSYVGDILLDLPHASFDDMLLKLASSLGQTKSDLVSRYRRLHKVYSHEKEKFARQNCLSSRR